MRVQWEPSWGRAPRRSVDGGVVVAKPGQVSHPDAMALLDQVEIEANPRMLSRGRSYARAGQVVSVTAGPGRFSAQIQGTGAKPYEVVLERTVISGSDRVAATCSCPYGCDVEWCKHAAALGYVAAFLLERDAGARRVWEQDPKAAHLAEDSDFPGSEAPDPGEVLDASVLEDLLLPPPSIDVVQVLRDASDVVPHPRWRRDD